MYHIRTRLGDARVALAASIISVTMVIVAATSIAYANNSGSASFSTGMQQALSISDAAQNGLNLQPGFTIEAWIKLVSQPSQPGGSTYTIASKYGAANGFLSYDFSYSNSVAGGAGPTNLRLGVTANGQGNSTGTNYINLLVHHQIPIGEWHHVAVTYSATGTATFYVDGINVGSASGGPTSIFASPASFRIGGIENDTDGFFDGLIDDVRVWQAVRTPADIANDRFTETPSSTTGLVGYWHMNDGTFADASGNGNTLTNINGVTVTGDVPFSGPVIFPAAARKSADESISNSIVLQDDDQLVVGLEAGKSYSVEADLFVSAGNGTPDLKIALAAPAGSEITVGYLDAFGGTTNAAILTSLGIASGRIPVSATNNSHVTLRGTVVAGTDGVLRLQWAQFAANAAPVTIKKGSYLRVTEI